MTLAIHRERSADGFVVRLIGEFDPRMAGAISQAILSTPESSVVLDVSELKSLNGNGVRAIVEARGQLAGEGKALRVVGADDEVLTAIELSEPSGFAEEPLDVDPRVVKPRRGIRQR